MFPVRPLLRFRTEAQRRRHLTALARPDGMLAAIAFTEAHAGSDVAAMRTEARREGDAYLLTGEKVYVTNGGIAELTLVFAKLDREITAFLVKRGDPGVEAGPQGTEARSARLVYGVAAAGRCPASGGPPPR